MSRDTDRPIAVKGLLRTVDCAVRANGSVPARDFIGDLDDANRTRVFALLDRMANHGRISNREQFKKVGGKIFEFKRYQIRLGCFQVGDTWRLTHGFIKKKRDWPKQEIERANNIMTEDLERDTPGAEKGRRTRE